MGLTLRFLSEDSLSSFIVRRFTWSQWSHVEIALPDGTYLGARFNGGVLIRPHDYIKPLRQAFATVACNEDMAMAFARAQLRKPYDWKCIAGITFHEDWYNRKKWICSELVYAACLAGGNRILDEPKINRITPQMIFESPEVVPVDLSH